MKSRALPLLLVALLAVLVSVVAAGRYVDTLRAEADAVAALRRGALPVAASMLPPADPSLLLAVGSEAAAQALLVERVKSAVEQAGGAVIALQPRQAEARGGGGEVALRTQFVADTAALQKALHSLESAKPALIVETLLVRARNAPGSAEPTKLDVTLDVLAFRVPG
jgi:hypothetical protein